MKTLYAVLIGLLLVGCASAPQPCHHPEFPPNSAIPCASEMDNKGDAGGAE